MSLIVLRAFNKYQQGDVIKEGQEDLIRRYGHSVRRLNQKEEIECAKMDLVAREKFAAKLRLKRPEKKAEASIPEDTSDDKAAVLKFSDEGEADN